MDFGVELTHIEPNEHIPSILQMGCDDAFMDWPMLLRELGQDITDYLDGVFGRMCSASNGWFEFQMRLTTLCLCDVLPRIYWAAVIARSA